MGVQDRALKLYPALISKAKNQQFYFSVHNQNVSSTVLHMRILEFKIVTIKIVLCSIMVCSPIPTNISNGVR